MIDYNNLPPIETKVIDGQLWIKQLDSEEYIQLGVAPIPKSQLQAFVYHVCHGIIMRYSMIDILLWSWQNKDSFEAS